MDDKSYCMKLRDFEKILKKNDYVFDHQTGDHRIWYKDGKHISVSLSRLKNPMLVKRLVKENELEL